MIQKLRCLLYTVYDWSKGSFLINWLFYREPGKRYQHFFDMTVEGVVTAVELKNYDGDINFDIDSWNCGKKLHCEITPCHPISLDVMNKIHVGSTVLVTGTYTYDPTHLGTPGHWEIHPVKKLEVL